MHFAGLFLKRLYYFIWFAPDNLVSKEARLNNKVSKLPYGLILISCIIGVILSLRKYPKGCVSYIFNNTFCNINIFRFYCWASQV